MKPQGWCLHCGRDVTSNTGWKCDECGKWTCLGCRHRCAPSIPPTPTPRAPLADNPKETNP